jgi:hypothetical protein
MILKLIHIQYAEYQNIKRIEPSLIISAKIQIIKLIFYHSSYKSVKYFCYEYFFIHLHSQTANVAGDLIPCFAIIKCRNG